MDTTFSTNILFSMLSIFIFIATLGFAVAMLFLISIFKNINLALQVIKKEFEKISDDIEKAREKVRSGEAMIASFASYIASFFKGRPKDSKK